MEDKGNRPGLDLQVNVANIIAAFLLLCAIVRYGGETAYYMQQVNAKVAVLWAQFKLDQPDKARQYETVFP